MLKSFNNLKNILLSVMFLYFNIKCVVNENIKKSFVQSVFEPSENLEETHDFDWSNKILNCFKNFEAKYTSKTTGKENDPNIIALKIRINYTEKALKKTEHIIVPIYFISGSNIPETELEKFNCPGLEELVRETHEEEMSSFLQEKIKEHQDYVSNEDLCELRDEVLRLTEEKNTSEKKLNDLQNQDYINYDLEHKERVLLGQLKKELAEAQFLVNKAHDARDKASLSEKEIKEFIVKYIFRDIGRLIGITGDLSETQIKEKKSSYKNELLEFLHNNKKDSESIWEILHK